MDQACLAERVNLKTTLLARLVCDCHHIQVVLFKEEAAIDELSVTLEFFFNEQLRYIVHDLWAEVLQFKKLYHWI